MLHGTKQKNHLAGKRRCQKNDVFPHQFPQNITQGKLYDIINLFFQPDCQYTYGAVRIQFPYKIPAVHKGLLPSHQQIIQNLLLRPRQQITDDCAVLRHLHLALMPFPHGFPHLVQYFHNLFFITGF